MFLDDGFWVLKVFDETEGAHHIIQPFRREAEEILVYQPPDGGSIPHHPRANF